MASQKFNTSRDFLIDRIFVPQPPKQGQVWTNLNVTVLPDYLIYIKNNLTKQEQLLLSDYHLQTYMLETALKPHPQNDFDACTNEIINHIRSHPQFWVKKKGNQQQSLKMHQAIQQYHKDCDIINQFKISEKYPEKQYKVNNCKKIENDSVYLKNQFVKAAHRFNSTLYPWVSQYVCQGEHQQSYIKMFILDLLVSLAIKARPIERSYQMLRMEEEKQTKVRIQKQIQKFNDFLLEKDVDCKSLSTIKDSYVIANGLLLAISFLQAYKLKLTQNNTQEQSPKKFDYQQIQRILIDLANRYITKYELEVIIPYLLFSEFEKSCDLLKIRDSQEESSKDPCKGLYGTMQDLQQAFENYNEIVNHPENANRMKYKLDGSEVPWTQDLYLKFLQGFLQFFNVPTNNKKIAAMMGKNIEPNHVKHVKGLYMRNMASRIDVGQIGGGKKGIFESKIEFLKRDIQNFSMKWFKKENRTKTKRIKKRKKRQIYEGEEHDSDY